MRLAFRLFLFAAAIASGPAAAGSITDLSQWRLVQDPPNARFSGSAGSSAITLSARGGPIPSGTDIGFQSVSGDSVASSGAGFYFSPSQSFSLAIDFALSFGGAPSGVLAIGFGIGEDIHGTDSAGVTMLTNDGAAFGTFGAAGRTDDGDLVPVPISVGAALQGALFLTYDAPSGDVILGAAQSPGAGSPVATATYFGIQNDWDDEGLLVSVFLRSQSFTIPLTSISEPPWQAGDADASFFSLRVLSGTPIEIDRPAGIPLPPTLALLVLGLLLLHRQSRRLNA
jgi:hypothetical protein